MIQIVNRRTYRGASEYVGRPSVLGNPFVIGRDGGRAEVLQKYRRWLWGEMQSRNEVVLAELQRLAALAQTGDVIFSCWCSPEPCHAEILRAAVGWLQTQTDMQSGELR